MQCSSRILFEAKWKIELRTVQHILDYILIGECSSVNYICNNATGQFKQNKNTCNDQNWKNSLVDLATIFQTRMFSYVD